MPHRPTRYLSATRHPWPCLLFLLPLLLAYEGGVLWLGGAHPEVLRNGADTWLHWALEVFGLHQLYWVPVLITLVLLAWSWVRRDDRPSDLASVCLGMVIESAVFAVGLWGLSRGLGPLLDHLGIQLATTESSSGSLEQVISYVGAGIYEEALFRLLILSALLWLLQEIQLAGPVAFLVAATGSAALFSAAHHFGPFGEVFHGYVFLFRTMAGLYFAFLFQLRGFGIAVGAHACYDVFVGVVIG